MGPRTVSRVPASHFGWLQLLPLGCNHLLRGSSQFLLWVLWLHRRALGWISLASKSGDWHLTAFDWPWHCDSCRIIRGRSWPAACSIPPRQLMPPTSSSDSLEEVTIRLGDLTIDIRVSRAASTGGEPVPFAQPELVVSGSQATQLAGSLPEVPSGVIASALAAQTSEQLSELPLGDLWKLANKLRGTDPSWTPHARIGRAFKAGAIAALRLEGQITGQTVPSIPYKNSIYVILRGPHLPQGGWTPDFKKYLRAVQPEFPGNRNDFHPDSASHAFATQAEAEAFLAGAGKQWPHLLQ